MYSDSSLQQKLYLFTNKVKVMKNYIATFVLAFTVISLSAATINPIKESTLISNIAVEVTIDDALSDLFTVAKFDITKNSFQFEVENNISFIQIFNDKGLLEFQLPILSNKVQISKNIFPSSGDYNLGFMIDGEQEVKFSKVTIK